VAYVTGCDDRFSLLAQALSGSFGQHCPGHTLWVCDFGLGESRRREFRERGVLLDRPLTLPPRAHPWVCKAQLDAYTEPLSAEWLVWLDSDCLVTGPLSGAVEAVIGAAPQHGDVVAVCPGRIGSTFEIAQRFSSASSIMVRSGIPGPTPYYNTGMCIVRSPGLLAAWAREIEDAGSEGMFEQDLFNVLLQREGVTVVPLDHDVWNVTHHALDLCSVDEDGVSCHGKPVLVVHATGSFQELIIDEDGYLGYFRALNHPQLRSLQRQALSRWR
jgi:hypothetical protein